MRTVGVDNEWVDITERKIFNCIVLKSSVAVEWCSRWGSSVMMVAVNVGRGAYDRGASRVGEWVGITERNILNCVVLKSNVAGEWYQAEFFNDPAVVEDVGKDRGEHTVGVEWMGIGGWVLKKGRL